MAADLSEMEAKRPGQSTLPGQFVATLRRVAAKSIRMGQEKHANDILEAALLNGDRLSNVAPTREQARAQKKLNSARKDREIAVGRRRLETAAEKARSEATRPNFKIEDVVARMREFEAVRAEGIAMTSQTKRARKDVQEAILGRLEKAARRTGHPDADTANAAYREVIQLAEAVRDIEAAADQDTGFRTAARKRLVKVADQLNAQGKTEQARALVDAAGEFVTHGRWGARSVSRADGRIDKKEEKLDLEDREGRVNDIARGANEALAAGHYEQAGQMLLALDRAFESEGVRPRDAVRLRADMLRKWKRTIRDVARPEVLGSEEELKAFEGLIQQVGILERAAPQSLGLADVAARALVDLSGQVMSQIGMAGSMIETAGSLPNISLRTRLRIWSARGKLKKEVKQQFTQRIEEVKALDQLATMRDEPEAEAAAGGPGEAGTTPGAAGEAAARRRPTVKQQRAMIVHNMASFARAANQLNYPGVWKSTVKKYYLRALRQGFTRAGNSPEALAIVATDRLQRALVDGVLSAKEIASLLQETRGVHFYTLWGHKGLIDPQVLGALDELAQRTGNRALKRELKKWEASDPILPEPAAPETPATPARRTGT